MNLAISIIIVKERIQADANNFRTFLVLETLTFMRGCIRMKSPVTCLHGFLSF